jgi:hypothetical protein
VSEPIAEVLERLYGLPSWDVHWGRGTGLTLKFGEPHLSIREPTPESKSGIARGRLVRIEGAWDLWVWQAHWRLSELDGMSPVTSAESYRRITMGCSRLGGQKLVDVTINPRTGATSFRFDLGAILDVRRYSVAEDYPMWQLRTPERDMLGVRGTGEFEFGPADESDLPWRRLATASRA